MTVPTVWASGTPYNLDEVVIPYTYLGTGFFFRCVVAGTTGANEPFWPTAIGNKVADGTAEWQAVSIIAGDLQTSSPSAIIELYELELFEIIHGVSQVYRFHAGSNYDIKEIIWKGKSYTMFPIEADGFEYRGDGTLPRPTIKISNALGSITSLILALPRGLEGAKVTRIRTLVKFLDAANYGSPGAILAEDGTIILTEDSYQMMAEALNPAEDVNAEFPQEIFYVDRKTAENRQMVEFELVSSLDLAGVRAPKRQCIGNICQWRYRSAECSYTGTNYFDSEDNAVTTVQQDVCGKRLSSCRVRFGADAQLPFGSFPGVGSRYA